MLQSICPLINSLFFQYLVGSAVMLLGIKAMIYLCNYIFYRFSPVRSFPDVTTLSGWAMVGLLVAFVSPVAFFFCELGGLFSDQLVRTLLPIIVILIVVSPIGIFKHEKRAWLRRNPKHSRLFLPKYNKRVRNFGVSISKVDDITYGRGVSFSWFDGYFIAAGRHRVTFQFYEYRFLKRRTGHKVIYKKEMEFNFHPGTVYVIEVLPDIQTFRIVEDKTRFV